MMDRRQRTIELLVVEDNPADARLIKEALALTEWRPNIHVVADGESALAFLRREGPYADAPRAHFVILDLNIPRLDGRGVLSAMKADPVLAHIPVVILTTSMARADIESTYALHANAYLAKPVGLDDFVTVMESLAAFWFAHVQLPEEVSDA